MFLLRFVLGVHKSDGLDDLGPVVGRNAIILLLVWLMVFYCCVKGIRSLAKVFLTLCGQINCLLNVVIVKIKILAKILMNKIMYKDYSVLCVY
jgi:hypothetical protein